MGGLLEETALSWPPAVQRLRRVEEQIEKQLLESGRVAIDPHGRRGMRRYAKGRSPRDELRQCGMHCGVDDRHDVDSLSPNAAAAGDAQGATDGAFQPIQCPECARQMREHFRVAVSLLLFFPGALGYRLFGPAGRAVHGGGRHARVREAEAVRREARRSPIERLDHTLTE